MQNKQINEERVVDDGANQDAGNQDMNQDSDRETEIKIGFKNQKSDEANIGDMKEKWKKVESIISVAKDAYQSGKSDFRDVIGSMVATFQDMLASEDGSGSLGGLYGGPQMDIPAEPASEEQQQQ